MTTTEKTDIIKQIESALDTVRPHLKVDGGNVEIVDLTEEMLVKLKWLGNCKNCNMTAMTMKAGVEQTLKSKIPEIQSIEAVNGIS